MAYVIFDLDGTVIDTKHRYRDTPEGVIDLDYWFENSTPEKIALDGLLPLANTMRTLYDAGHTIVVCTARSWERDPRMSHNPGPIYERFLQDNRLYHHTLLYRNMAGADHHLLGDGDLKVKLLTDYAKSQGLNSIEELKAIMFDDNLKVIETLQKRGVEMIDATSANANLARLERERRMAA